MSAGGAPAVSRREARGAVAALAFVIAVTAVWWALALWPTPGEPPAWLARARWVCFNVGQSGLPDAAGWLLLAGQPLGLVAVLALVWGGALREGLRALVSSRAGRALVAVASLCIVVGLGAAAVRVASARSFDPSAPDALAAEPLPSTYPRLDRPAPALGGVDQHGARVDLARLAGRPALVTFAFAHCETVCPALVRQALDAQRLARDANPDAAPRLVIVTLDPWRDTPSRLPSLAQSWQLEERDAWVVSGGVDEVNALLDRWQVPRTRSETNGQVDHPALTYVLDAQGRIAYAATATGASGLAELALRADDPPG